MMIRLTIFALGSLLIACGDRSSAGASNVVKSTGQVPPTPNGPRVTSATAASVASGPSGEIPAEPVPATSDGRKLDSAIMLMLATQPKSRTMADSISLVAAIRAGLKNPSWPVQTAPPLPGSILPQKRIVAFYGNPLSKRMGILGEIPYDQMLTKLDTFVDKWRVADPNLPVQPALHLIVSVAQGHAGQGRLLSPAL